MGVHQTIHGTTHDERSKKVATDQDRVIERCFSSKIGQFLEQPSVLDDAIVDRKIKDRHKVTIKDSDEPIHDEDPLRYKI